MAIRLALETLDRRCLNLCISLLDHSIRGDTFESILVGALATIGIDQKQHAFYEPANYTSHLSAFIKIG
jgi:hypothetical protein